jgi:predicted acetyltransferase
MSITIRPLQGEAMLETLYNLNQYSLHPTPPFQDREEWNAQVRNRRGVTCHALYQDDDPVSIACSTAMTQNLRGQLYPASGVWGVSTLPAVRRQGYCRQNIASLLAVERDSGKVFSNLYPFRESFYQSLGYVAFPLAKIVQFAPPCLAPLLDLETGGHLELQLIGPGFQVYRDYLAAMRLRTHGMAFFDYGDQSVADRNLLYLAQARFSGELEGLMLYRLTGEEPTKFKFMAVRFYYQTSRARYLFLNWIARHIDQADRAELWLSPAEFPETWLADFQLKLEGAARPAMTRVLDVEKIGGMQVGEGAFTARVLDPLCPWNEDYWKFSAHGGQLQVERAPAADTHLTIQGLSALVAGTIDPADLPLRGWGDPSPTIQSAQRSLFPRRIPYMHEIF